MMLDLIQIQGPSLTDRFHKSVLCIVFPNVCLISLSKPDELSDALDQRVERWVMPFPQCVLSLEVLSIDEQFER